MNLALFDFDGTITKKDSLLCFIRYSVGNLKFIIGFTILSPIILAYKFKIISNTKAKEKLLFCFFKNISEEEFRSLATRFSLEYLDTIIRDNAIKTIQKHKKDGDEVVIVSASIECWLKPWCEKNNIKLLSTKLSFKNNRYIGKFSTKNCYGQEKVNRILLEYNLHQYEKIYAYGDSSGDRDMLKLADIKYFKPFRD